MAKKAIQIDLGETGRQLQEIADREGLDGGYGEFDFFITAILATREGISPDEYKTKYDWEQGELTDPVIVTEKEE